jgi:hypothetical protein
MRAVVVTWPIRRGEMDLDELTKEVNWLIEEQVKEWRESAFAVYDYTPKVYFTDPTYPQIFRKEGGNQKDVWSGSDEFAMVITDEPITQTQADAIMAQYYGEGDKRGDYYRLLIRRRDAGPDTGGATPEGVEVH